jgi:isopenicillin-N epimerase
MNNISASNLQLDASPWKAEFPLPPDVTYLNHGSFGPSPRCVRDERQRWSERLETQPMQFFVRELEEALDAAAASLGEFVGAAAKDLIFVDNATYGMNIVAASLDLQPGDEVLLTDHEYGAVVRLWRRKCQSAGAKVVTAPLAVSHERPCVDSLFQSVTDRTRLIVISHVTSPTALILPVKEICREAGSRGIPVCIDGPHALAMLPLSLRNLGCDFYVASCHKWLCGPFGSGFLYVSPQWQGKMQPAVVSWGGSVAGRQPSWKDEFQWIGTRDPAAFLAVPAAIEFLRRIGIDLFRRRGHELATEFCRRMETFAPDPGDFPESLGSDTFGTMAAMPLPDSNTGPPKPGQRDPLQDALWERYRIEIPVVHWQGRRLLRVSCHLYNDEADLDRLFEALETLLPRFSR